MFLPRNAFRLLAVLLASLALPARSLHAQAVRGRVVEAETGAPVPGAIVQLLQPSGARVTAALADSAGRYRLAAPTGNYLLRAERVGFATDAPSAVALAEGEVVEHEIRVASRRVVLDAVVAEGRRRRCAGEPQNGARAARLWDEARKVLLASTLAEEGGYTFTSRMRRRELYLRGRGVMSDRGWTVTSAGLPFLPASGEQLVRTGYVHHTPDSVVAQGLGAQALLSDAFLRHHCFGVREGGSGRPGLVGLDFVPLEGRVLPDVKGVLWLDRVSGELRFVEYTYTGLRYRGPVDEAGGRVDFRRLPGGAWVVSSWAIRVPRLRDVGGDPNVRSPGRYRVWAVTETRGEVLEIRAPDGTAVPLQ